MRVLQIHTFYDRYLNTFYNAHKELQNKCYAEQNKTLFRNGFSAIHMISKYLPNCEAELIIANCIPMQKRWADEHNNISNNNAWSKNIEDEIVRQQIEKFEPDILYLTDPIRFNGEFIKTLRSKPPLVIGWRCADTPFNIDWHGFDIMLSGLPRLLEFAIAAGTKKGIYFVPGMPEWISHEISSIKHDTDIVFAGSISPTQHYRRLQFLDILVQAASQGKFSLSLHLMCNPKHLPSSWKPFLLPPVFGIDMHKALRRGKIVFDVQGEIGIIKPDGSRGLDLANGDTMNMRLFEGTGGGSLVMTDAKPGLDKLFEPGQEIITFNDGNELIEKATYYLKHELERKMIAARGAKRCLTQWSMTTRAKAFVNMVREQLCADEA